MNFGGKIREFFTESEIKTLRWPVLTNACVQLCWITLPSTHTLGRLLGVCVRVKHVLEKFGVKIENFRGKNRECSNTTCHAHVWGWCYRCGKAFGQRKSKRTNIFHVHVIMHASRVPFFVLWASDLNAGGRRFDAGF